MTPFRNAAVAARFDAYPAHVKPRLLTLRELIFQAASAIPAVGEIEETLKWGEPAYVTPSKSGSTLRMDWKARDPNHYALYFHCGTNLVETFRSMFPHDFIFEGNRALLFRLEDKLPEDALALCLEAALTYHLKRRKTKG